MLFRSGSSFCQTRALAQVGHSEGRAHIGHSQDAKRHPDYAQYEHDLRNVPLGPKPEFDKMNFLRYLAMAAVGGGLMADVDVFPLWPLDDERDGGRFQNAMSSVLDTSLDDATADLPFNGKFSLLCGGPGSEVPCLMSGTASQWSHVANVLLENGRRQDRKSTL